MIAYAGCMCAGLSWVAGAQHAPVHIDHPVVADVFERRLVREGCGVGAPKPAFGVPGVNDGGRTLVRLADGLAAGCCTAVDDQEVDVAPLLAEEAGWHDVGDGAGIHGLHG